MVVNEVVPVEVVVKAEVVEVVDVEVELEVVDSVVVSIGVQIQTGQFINL